jgi:hypothetical protein
MTDTATRYGGWSRDRQGWFLGQTAGTWITGTAAGLPVLLGVGTHRWLFVAAWLPVWAAVIAVLTVPVRGRSAARWATDSLIKTVGDVMLWTSWQARACTGRVDNLDQPDLPGVLAGIHSHDGPRYGVSGARVALIQDRIPQTWAVVARIAHPGIGLAELDERDLMGAGLSELLEQLSTAELVQLVALQVRTMPDDGAERASWQRHHLRPDAPRLARQVTADLDGAVLRAGVRHEAFITVVVREQRLKGPAKDAGGGVDGRARVLHGVMSELERALLGGIGCTAVDWLDAPALAAAIRTGYAPEDRAGLIDAASAAPDNRGGAGATVGVPMGLAGPGSALRPGRRHYQHDAWSSVSCTVVLPDKGVVMGAFAPLLVPAEAGERRCVTFFYEPIGQHRADKLIGGGMMSADLSQTLLRRGGFTIRARHRRETDRVHRQDERLATGRALVRSAVAAAVTVPSTWSISDAGRRLESSIRSAGFHPQRLDLAQDAGFVAAAIPLGIGLPRRRSTP